MGKRKVSKEEELEICRRYELGESAAEIDLNASSRKFSGIYRNHPIEKMRFSEGN